MPSKFSLSSTNEFLNLLSSNGAAGTLVSLDVESLFTSISVRETIKIILDYAYLHPDIPPPEIPTDVMENLFLTCTTDTPFRHPNGDIYVQVEGVCLYGLAVRRENKDIDEVDPQMKPFMYIT